MNTRRPTDAAGDRWRKWGAQPDDDRPAVSDHFRAYVFGALVITVVVAGAILALLITAFAVGRASAAPRTALTTTPQPGAPGAVGSVDASARAQAGTSAGPSGAPLEDSRAPSTSAALDGQASSGGAPIPSPAAATTDPSPATSRGIASYCAPTPTHCQSWGGGAMLGAVSSFRWGDRPYDVRVCRADARTRCTVVTVVSFCGCPDGRVIDLSPAAFRRLAPLSAGLVRVTVERLGPATTPPPTNTEAVP